jgi:hypothetical protein
MVCSNVFFFSLVVIVVFCFFSNMGAKLRFGSRVQVTVSDKVYRKITMLGSDGRCRLWRLEYNENRVRDDRMAHLT